ncbi:hypothetical protein [Halomontanus rarus]|uniref:hypothetical protein n=1 Tax=Halomontanus rarus TaxID=3034020 RepID=UPI0023E8B08B|nr:hypothetical protein [Halovivax sp. TS33]
MTRTTLTAALAVVLVTSLFATGATGVLAAQDDPEPTCSTEVSHDAFLSDELVDEFNETGNASSIERNTRLTVEETTSFYRVKGENPNSYCVHVTAEIDDEILPPTNLGTVESNSGTTDAEWEDVLDFDRQNAYTEIEFIMPANSTVLFAPSKPTILIPAWRDSKKHDAEGILATVSSFFEDDDLEQREYTFEANDSPHVTVPLTNDEDGEQRIDDWRAVYRSSPSEPWDPVDKDTDDDVFYQEIEDGDKIRFYFNDKNAEVEFTANPTRRDKATWEYRSFKRSLHDLSDYWPFGMAAPTLGGGLW